MVVENFRPGTMKRFNLDYDTVRKAKPDIIYVSISAYGQTGPMSHRPGIDLMVQAISGLMSTTGAPDGPAYKAGGPIADIVGGFSAVMSVMASLMEREKTGKGRYIDIAMLDAVMMVLNQQIVTVNATGKLYPRVGNAHPLMAPYESFMASDREFVMAVTNEKAWKAFISIPEFAHLGQDPQFQTQVDRNLNRVRMLDADSRDIQNQYRRLLAERTRQARHPFRADSEPRRGRGAPARQGTRLVDGDRISAQFGRRDRHSRHALEGCRRARRVSQSAGPRPAHRRGSRGALRNEGQSESLSSTKGDRFMVNWKSHDAMTGIMFLAVAVYYGTTTLLQLDLGTPEEMGPGFFPFSLSVILAILGVLVLLRAKRDEEEQPPVNWRAVILVGSAPIAFGLTVRSLGLAPALLISVGLAVLSSSRIGLMRGAAIIVGVTVFCVLVFKFGVGVPYPLINPEFFG